MVKEVAFFADIESLDKYYLNSIRNVQEMKYSLQGGGYDWYHNILRKIFLGFK